MEDSAFQLTGPKHPQAELLDADDAKCSQCWIPVTKSGPLSYQSDEPR